MTRRMILPLLFGLIGAAVLIWLGLWQVERLRWKEAVLDAINTRIDAPPVSLAEAELSPDLDYQSVSVTGQFIGEELHVLVSLKHIGAVYRVISGFETDAGRRVLIDRGFIAIEDKDRARNTGALTLTGNLHTPDEIDSFTPDPDLVANIWFARDAVAMADVLATEPVFIILRETSLTDPFVTPLPVDTSVIPNDHFGYALTWFSLAIVWLGMTVFILWRIRRNTL